MSLSPRAGALVRAGAEFTVIVVGVLVALAVDSWVGQRTDRETERKQLEQLAGNLRVDSSLFVNRLLPRATAGEVAVRAIRPIAVGEAPFPDDTIALLRQVTQSAGLSGGGMLGPREAYDALVASGSLDVIELPELRAAITGYYSRKGLAERQLEGGRSEIGVLVRGMLPRPSRGSPLSVTPQDGDAAPSEQEFRDFGVRQAAIAIQTPEFVAALNRQGNFYRLAKDLFEELLSNSTGLLRRIESELEGLR